MAVPYSLSLIKHTACICPPPFHCRRPFSGSCLAPLSASAAAAVVSLFPYPAIIWRQSSRTALCTAPCRYMGPRLRDLAREFAQLTGRLLAADCGDRVEWHSSISGGRIKKGSGADALTRCVRQAAAARPLRNLQMKSFHATETIGCSHVQL